MNRYLLSAFLCLFGPQGLAMTVADPQNQAEHLKLFFPESTSTPFTCDQAVKYVQSVSRCDIICEKNPCEERCQQTTVTSYQVEAQNCTNDNIDIFSSLAWSLQVPKKSDLKYGQTWLEEFLTSTDFFITPSGTYEIKFVMPPGPRTWVDENGDEHTLEVVRVYLDYKQSTTAPAVPFVLDLDLNQRGVGQILYFGKDGSDDYFVKKWGLLK